MRNEDGFFTLTLAPYNVPEYDYTSQSLFGVNVLSRASVNHIELMNMNIRNHCNLIFRV